MRPRHLLILALLAVIPLALAVVLGSGSSQRAGREAGPYASLQVALRLVGAHADAAISACGATHHDKIYTAGSTIAFRGSVSPPANLPAKLKLKLKLKACFDGAFQPAGDVSATLAADGSFWGRLPAPSGGTYFARAQLERHGALITRSRKRYFEVR